MMMVGQQQKLEKLTMNRWPALICAPSPSASARSGPFRWKYSATMARVPTRPPERSPPGRSPGKEKIPRQDSRTFHFCQVEEVVKGWGHLPFKLEGNRAVAPAQSTLNRMYHWVPSRQ